MYNEIGSNFWFKKEDKNNIECNIDIKIFKNIEFKNEVYTSSGRSAIEVAIESANIDRKIALLPAFTCHTVIEPFLKHQFEIVYYNILENLTVDKDDFIEKIEKNKPSILLVHSYFGFDTINGLIEYIEQQENLVIIEDLTQSLLSNIKHIKADYYIGSFRKWGAIYDGGFALITGEKALNQPLEINHILVDKKIKAFDKKYDYMENNIGEKYEFLPLLSSAEDEIENIEDIKAMSNQSKNILNNLNLDKLRQKRYENFKFLLENLKDISEIDIIFKEIDVDITPLYFVLKLKNRQELQKFLAQNNIYAPVIWPKPHYVESKINDKTNAIYNEILAIPCDQRYGKEEMQYICDKFHEYFENRG